MRSAIAVQWNGLTLQGTVDHPTGWDADATAGGTAEPRVGIFCWNAGHQPRSAQGDLAAHLTTYTAQLGFPSFRFDMPGLGDSQGDLPPEVLAFYETVQEGGHVAAARAIKTELMRRYHLQGLIFMGHCGSATTSVYLAEQDASPDLLGLILLEPSFIWYRAPHPPKGKAKSGWRAKLRLGLDQLRLAVRARLVRLPLGEALSVWYARTEAACRRLRGARLPADTNQRLLTCYRTVLAKPLPVLMVMAPPIKKRPDYFSHARYVEAKCKAKDFTLVEIEGASHSFLEGDGRKVLPATLRDWLQKRFPSAARQRPAAPPLESTPVAVGAD